MKKIYYKIKKIFFQCDDKLLYLKAFFITGVMRFIIVNMPFKKYKNLLGRHNEQTEYNISNEEEKYAEKIGYIIERISRYTLWKSNCFVKAMTAQKLLYDKKIETTLYMGICNDDAHNITAHAWVRCGNIFVVGGDGKGYKVAGTFRKSIKEV